LRKRRSKWVKSQFNEKFLDILKERRRNEIAFRKFTPTAIKARIINSVPLNCAQQSAADYHEQGRPWRRNNLSFKKISEGHRSATTPRNLRMAFTGSKQTIILASTARIFYSKKKDGINNVVFLERVGGVGPPSSPWQGPHNSRYTHTTAFFKIYI